MILEDLSTIVNKEKIAKSMKLKSEIEFINLVKEISFNYESDERLESLMMHLL